MVVRPGQVGQRGLLLQVLCVLLLCCAGARGEAAEEDDARHPPLKLRSDPVRFTVKQRRARDVPGSRGRLTVHLGDITGGAVSVNLRDRAGKRIISETKLRGGESLQFALSDRKYHLRLDSLTNFIVGDDFAIFSLSTRPFKEEGPGEANALPAQERPARWAQPVKLEGAPNLHRVDKGFYRSAQPTAEGMKRLRKMGVVTIINLRSWHTDLDEVGTTGLALERLPVDMWRPERERVVRFLQIVSDSKRRPVLMHCRFGADRTGVMAAVYRMAVQGWTAEEAAAEMTRGGFGFHAITDAPVKFLTELDVNKLRRQAGLSERKAD